MSKVCMAAVNDNDRTFTLGRLQERFPEIPEGVISKILAQHAHNMEKCLLILSQESEKYLYGESMDSPGAKPSSSVIEPLSIDIPENDAGHPSAGGSLEILPQSTMTVAVPSSSGTTILSGGPRERHHSADEFNDYNQKVIQHQRQRLDRLRIEYETGKLKLAKQQALVKEKEEELMNKKFRIAGNPTKLHVDHLLEETEVLRTEIDLMTKEIDNINNGASPLGFVSNSQPSTENNPSPHHRQIPPVRKSASFPRTTGQYFTPCSWRHNSHPPVEGMHGPRPPWLPPMGENANTTQSPVRDSSLEGWTLLPNEFISAPIRSTTTVDPPPPPPPDDTEQTWRCKHCTLDNHGALNVCEACEMPRN